MTKALLIIDIQNDYFENGKWNLLDLKKRFKMLKRYLKK
jgi:nicotinamidase-related amidase